MFSGTAQVSHQVCHFFCQFCVSSCECSIVVSAGKLGKLWDSLSELRSSVCERRLERTVLRPALLPAKTAQFTQFFPSRMMSHSKIAQFNWQCIQPLRLLTEILLRKAKNKTAVQQYDEVWIGRVTGEVNESCQMGDFGITGFIHCGSAVAPTGVIENSK